MSEDRFSRQEDLIPRDKLLVEDIGVIGVGAVGRQVALQLAAIGAGKVTLYDHDSVEDTNITTQGFRQSDVGSMKVDAVATAMLELDSSIQITKCARKFEQTDRDKHSSIFCCVDSISARGTIWRRVRSYTEFWADARMLGEIIRVLAWTNRESECRYGDSLFEQEEAAAGRCTARSTIYAATIAAALMIHQFGRYLREIPVEQDVLLNLLACELTVPEAEPVG